MVSLGPLCAALLLLGNKIINAENTYRAVKDLSSLTFQADGDFWDCWNHHKMATVCNDVGFCEASSLLSNSMGEIENSF